jgi:predicted lipoprotein
MKLKQILGLALIILTFGSCVDPTVDRCATTYDQLTMLDNYGNNLILPGYEKFATETTTLQQYSSDFSNNPTLPNLQKLRTQFQLIWLQWQEISHFEFGPAAEIELKDKISNYPVFVSRLEDALSLSSYDLNTAFYSFARGLPALDYLLYGIGTDDNAILAKYTTDNLATARLAYLQKVTDLVAQYGNQVYDQWKPTGANYLNIFTTTEGVSNGSPVSNLINGLNQNYEFIKNDKIGTPIGAKTGYITNQNNIEAFYSRQSLDLITTALKSSKNVFEGGNGQGLDDYLAAANAKRGADDLHTIISNQYQKTIDLFEGISGSWYNAILNDANASQAAYAAAQNQVVYLKTDLPSALCVSIVYVDNVDDGD